MLETYMIYFIPISCIHNNLLNTFKSENGSLFYFILFYVSFILKLCTKKKKLCTQNNLSNTLKYENVLLLFFFLHSRFECKVNTERKRKKMKSECTTF